MQARLVSVFILAIVHSLSHSDLFLQRALQLEDEVMHCCVSGGITCVNDLVIQDYKDGENLKDFVRRRSGENEVPPNFPI